MAIRILAASIGTMKTKELLLTALLQLIVIIVAARVFAAIFRKFRQPSVVGEIAAGLVLGPSCFGRFFPAFPRPSSIRPWAKPSRCSASLG